MKPDRMNFRLFPRELAAWSLRQKLKNPFAGLRFFRRDSGGGLIIASRHWPHLLCWSWCLRWSWPDGGRSGTHHTWGIHRSRNNNGGWFVIGPLWLNWQAYREMVSSRHEGRASEFISKRAV